MSISNLSYKELAIPYFKEVFEVVDQTMIAHQIAYYLIGVNSIALELLKSGVRPNRGTKDIDFAIMISSIEQYHQVGDSLVIKGFNRVKAPWTFYSKEYNVAIDILPFGVIEQYDTQIFNNRYSDLHVLGFREILEDAESIYIEEIIVNIPPLPGMILLKLVSWSDRPEERENDLADILRIIEHYFDHNFNEIVHFYHDTFENDDFNKLLIAAEVLGRKARQFLRKTSKLENRILRILNHELIAHKESKIARDWASKKGWEIQYALKILAALQKGMKSNADYYPPTLP